MTPTDKDSLTVDRVPLIIDGDPPERIKTRRAQEILKLYNGWREQAGFIDMDETLRVLQLAYDAGWDDALCLDREGRFIRDDED